MSTFYFSLLYIVIGMLLVTLVWARSVVRKGPQGRPGFLNTTVILQQFALFLHLLSAFLFPLPLELDVPVRSLGLTFFTVGVFVAVWAKYTMRGSWGLPGQHNLTVQRDLVTDGPFSYTRNPIYVGIILMQFGIAIALKSAFIFIVFVLYNYLYTQVLIEEQLLRKYFGKAYDAYCKKVPRFI